MIKFEIKGAKELEAALRKLPQEIAGKVLREALKKSAEPMVDVAQRLAPRSETPSIHGHMADSIGLRTFKTTFDLFEMETDIWFGPDPTHFYGAFSEFGTKHQPARPFLRPAFDSEAESTIDRFGVELGKAIEKAAKKLRR